MKPNMGGSIGAVSDRPNTHAAQHRRRRPCGPHREGGSSGPSRPRRARGRRRITANASDNLADRRIRRAFYRGPSFHCPNGRVTVDKSSRIVEDRPRNAHRRDAVNRPEFCARIAARSLFSRADAVTAVDTVVSVIAHALERGETVNMASAELRRTPPVPALLPERVRNFATRAHRCVGVDLRTSPRRLPRHEGSRRSCSRRLRVIGPMRSARRSWTNSGRASCATLVAERRHRNSADSPFVRTSAQSRAAIESPRARVPYTDGTEFSASPVLRTAALQSKRTCFLPAYGVTHRPQPSGPLHGRQHGQPVSPGNAARVRMDRSSSSRHTWDAISLSIERSLRHFTPDPPLARGMHARRCDVAMRRPVTGTHSCRPPSSWAPHLLATKHVALAPTVSRRCSFPVSMRRYARHRTEPPTHPVHLLARRVDRTIRSSTMPNPSTFTSFKRKKTR